MNTNNNLIINNQGPTFQVTWVLSVFGSLLDKRGNVKVFYELILYDLHRIVYSSSWSYFQFSDAKASLESLMSVSLYVSQ